MVVDKCRCGSVRALPKWNGKRQIANNHGHACFADIPGREVEVCLDDGKDAIEEGDGNLKIVLLAKLKMEYSCRPYHRQRKAQNLQ